MTKVTGPFFSLGATKKSYVYIDFEGNELDAGFFIGTENGYVLAQENEKGIELERAYKYIYREKPTSKGRVTIRQRYFIPTNPQTTPQQENRGKFADAVLAWQNLTFTAQVVWNKLRYPEHMSGYNRYLRAYMKGEV